MTVRHLISAEQNVVRRCSFFGVGGLRLPLQIGFLASRCRDLRVRKMAIRLNVLKGVFSGEHSLFTEP